MKNCWNKILFATLLLGPVSAFADVNIAIITPMSGDYKYFSEELIDGAKIAVDEINNRGGLQGQKVNLVPIDDPCDDVLSLSAAQMMALNKSDEDKIYMVIGPQCNNSADQVADLLKKAKILQLHPTPISRVRYHQKQPTIIRFSGYKEEQVKELLRFIGSHYPRKTLAVVYDANNSEMASVADSIRNEYLSANDDRLIVAGYGIKSTDLNSALQKVLDGKASLVYVMGDSDQVVDITEKLRNADSEIVIFADRYQLNRKFAHKISRLSENSFILSLPPLTSNPNFASNLVRLRLWGIEPEGLMPYGYLSVKMWAGLVRDSHSFRYAKVLKQLGQGNINTGWDNVIYKNGVPDKSLPYVIYRVKDGEYTQVY